MLKRKELAVRKCHKDSIWQVRRSRLRQKEREQSHQSRVPDLEGGESQGEREPIVRGERVNVRRVRKKALYRRKRDSLEGPHEQVESETWEKLGLQRRCMLRKGKSAVRGDPKKS